MRNFLFAILAVGVAGCAPLLEATSKITAEQVSEVITSERPFATSLGVLAEIGACDSVVEIALGAPEELQTPETGVAAVKTCNNLVNAGAAFLPVNSTLMADGSVPSPLVMACRDANVRSDYLLDPAFEPLVEASCSAPAE